MTNIFTPRRLLTLAVSCLCLMGPQLADAQRWATMPAAPKHPTWQSSVSLSVSNLATPAPGVVWGSVGESGYHYYRNGLYQTGDNGLTWRYIDIASLSLSFGYLTGTSLDDYSVSNANTAWVVINSMSNSINTNSALSKIIVGSGGSNATVVTASLPAIFNRIHFLDATTGIAIAAPGTGTSVWKTYRTTDAGISWSAVPSALPAAVVSYQLEPLVSKAAIGTRWWVGTGTGNVLHTRDAGLTWTSASTGLGANLTGIAFRDANNGLAYGATGQLARTADGGLTWTVVANALPSGVTTLTSMPGAVGGYLCTSGSNGVLSSSVDDGTTWQTRYTDNMYFNSLAYGPDGQLWAAVRSNTGTLAFPGLEMLLRYAGAPLVARGEKNLAALAYPNPATGLVRLPGAQGAAVRVTDAAGRQVSCPRTADALDLTGVPAGLYFITVTTPAGQNATQRISVVH